MLLYRIRIMPEHMSSSSGSVNCGAIPTQLSSSGIPAGTQPEKRSSHALLARRHTLTPREVAHVCNALLRIAEQVTTMSLDITTEVRSDYSTSHALKENEHA